MLIFSWNREEAFNIGQIDSFYITKDGTMRIRDIASLPRRVQPVRHIISRKRRHREMHERAEQFRAMLENEIKRLDKKEVFDGR